MSSPEKPGPAAILTEWAISVHAFKRNRVPAVTKTVAASLCNTGYSYREVAKVVGGLSYIAVRDSYIALITSLPREAKKYRRAVAIDGSDVRVGEKDFHLWLARDVDSGEILEFGGSPDASAEDGARFLSRVATQCSNRPIVKLGLGASSPRGLLNLDLYFQRETSQSIIGRLGRMFLGSAS